jgi:hypothetical protein
MPSFRAQPRGHSRGTSRGSRGGGRVLQHRRSIRGVFRSAVRPAQSVELWAQPVAESVRRRANPGAEPDRSGQPARRRNRADGSAGAARARRDHGLLRRRAGRPSGYDRRSVAGSGGAHPQRRSPGAPGGHPAGVRPSSRRSVPRQPAPSRHSATNLSRAVLFASGSDSQSAAGPAVGADYHARGYDGSAGASRCSQCRGGAGDTRHGGRQSCSRTAGRRKCEGVAGAAGGGAVADPSINRALVAVRQAQLSRGSVPIGTLPYRLDGGGVASAAIVYRRPAER